MSLLDRVRDCTAWQPDRRVPLRVEGRVCGHLDPVLATALAAFPEVFRTSRRGVHLDPSLDTFEARTRAVGEVVDRLYRRGLFAPRRGELYPVVRRFAEAPLFALERGTVGAFGTSAFGVHLNGFVEGPRGVTLWIARRSAEKPTYPGRLDHLVGGGQPLGIPVDANMRKECGEEAGIPAPLLSSLRLVHRLRYRFADRYGLHDDTTFVFDLALPPGFEPESRDGEVAAFERWPIARVVATLRTTRAFKPNVALVILDWLLRRDLLAGDPERGALEAAIAPLRES